MIQPARIIQVCWQHFFFFKSGLQELFFKYSWNNFLHTQVERCITTVLNNPPTEEDGEQCTPLVDVVSLHRTFCVDVVGIALRTLETLIFHVSRDRRRTNNVSWTLSFLSLFVCLIFLRQLFKDCQIIQRILQEWEDLDSEK